MHIDINIDQYRYAYVVNLHRISFGKIKTDHLPTDNKYDKYR